MATRRDPISLIDDFRRDGNRPRQFRNEVSPIRSHFPESFAEGGVGGYLRGLGNLLGENAYAAGEGVARLWRGNKGEEVWPISQDYLTGEQVGQPFPQAQDVLHEAAQRAGRGDRALLEKLYEFENSSAKAKEEGRQAVLDMEASRSTSPEAIEAVLSGFYQDPISGAEIEYDPNDPRALHAIESFQTRNTGETRNTAEFGGFRRYNPMTGQVEANPMPGGAHAAQEGRRVQSEAMQAMADFQRQRDLRSGTRESRGREAARQEGRADVKEREKAILGLQERMHKATTDAQVLTTLGQAVASIPPEQTHNLEAAQAILTDYMEYKLSDAYRKMSKEERRAMDFAVLRQIQALTPANASQISKDAKEVAEV